MQRFMSDNMFDIVNNQFYKEPDAGKLHVQILKGVRHVGAYLLKSTLGHSLSPIFVVYFLSEEPKFNKHTFHVHHINLCTSDKKSSRKSGYKEFPEVLLNSYGGKNMKIIGVIPARYESTRFPGKPLVDICGKPMIWWVYQKVRRIKELSDVFCAIDDDRIQEICEKLGIKYIRTKSNHPEHISRIHEVSDKIESDYYICINGDEPLITSECIIPIFPRKVVTEPYFGGAMRNISSPAEVIDPANIKLVISETGKCLYMSRIPVPYPKGTLNVLYRKYVGVECFNKSALDFFVKTKMGETEKIEDIDHLRFLENGIDLYFSLIESDSISVDTPKDLDFVREKMKERLKQNSIERTIIQKEM